MPSTPDVHGRGPAWTCFEDARGRRSVPRADVGVSSRSVRLILFYCPFSFERAKGPKAERAKGGKGVRESHPSADVVLCDDVRDLQVGGDAEAGAFEELHGRRLRHSDVAQSRQSAVPEGDGPVTAVVQSQRLQAVRSVGDEGNGDRTRG